MPWFIIVLLSIILTACGVVQDIDRGLAGISDTLSTPDKITGRRSLNLTPRPQQIETSNEVSRKFIAEKYKDQKLNQELNPKQYQRLRRIFDRILPVTHLAGEDWTLILLPEPDFNAFVMGGTYLFINEGLMIELENDAEVAAVLAHEIAHVAANHVYERQAQQMAALASGSESIKTEAIQTTYTHNDEIEADKIGILYMALAGYDPTKASHIWEKMYKNRGNIGARFSSHPINSERLALTRQFAEQVSPYYIPGKPNPNAQEILKSLSHTTGPAVGEGGGLASFLEVSLGSVLDHKLAKAEAQRQQNRIHLLKSVQNSLVLSGINLNSSRTEVTAQFIYKGDIPLQGLSVRAISLPRTSKQVPEMSLARKAAIVRPGDGITFTFSFREAVDSENLRFEVDEASPL